MLHVLSYKTDIITVILCGCDIWCFTSREEHRLRVCESRGVRRIFDVRIEGCRKFCSELHVCYSSPDIINIIHNVACNMHIVKKKGIQSFLRKPEQEEPCWRLGRIMQISVFERNMMGGLDCFC
jgi:hypothetical protein